ncbi:MAG: DUF2007 domain-containing protein [Pseudomonadota bacterium]
MDFELNNLRAELDRLQDHELLRRCAEGFAEEAEPVARAVLRERDLAWPTAAAVEVPVYAGDWITLERTWTPTEAHVLRGLLVSADIPACVADQHLTQANDLWVPALGGVRLQVPADCLQAAQAVLEGFRRGEFALADDFDPGA